jgi:hypothetical protein
MCGTWHKLSCKCGYICEETKMALACTWKHADKLKVSKSYLRHMFVCDSCPKDPVHKLAGHKRWTKERAEMRQKNTERTETRIATLRLQEAIVQK